MPQIVRTLNSCLGFGLAWGALVIIAALWAGLAWLFSPIVFIVSFAAALYLHRKFPFEFAVPAPVWGISLLVLALVLSPVLLSGGVAASADAVTTTAMRVLADKIPQTYAPYSGVSFTYQLGFPLLAQTFSDIFPFIPDFQWAWLLGAIFAAALVPVLYGAVREWISPQAAIIAAVLAVAGKLVFQNFYVGEFAWLASTVYLLAAFFCWKKGHPFTILAAAAVAVLHPAIFFNLLVLLGIHYFSAGKADRLHWIGLALLLALPALYFTYLPIASNLLGGNSGSAGFDLGRIAQALKITPLWVGSGLSLLLAASIAALFLEKKRQQWKGAALFGIAFAVFLPLYSAGTVLANREIELVLLAAIFWASSNWAATSVFSRHAKPLLALFLLIGLASFYSSGTLADARAGSKISPQEIDFAFKFRELDPTAQKTVFLTPGAGKMAEIAGKIPYDANSNHLISAVDVLVIRNAGWGEFVSRHEYQEQIRKTRCAGCIMAIDGFEYAVINYDYAPIELPAPILLQVGGIKLYRIGRGS